MMIASLILTLSVLAADAARGKGEALVEVEAAADRRDVLLLLDGGPLHLRLHLSLEGVSLAEARRQYVGRLIDSLDADRDGELSREEAAKSPLLRTKARPGAAQFLKSLGGPTSFSLRDVDRAVDRVGGEPVAYRQDLSSSKNDLEVFKLLDTDANGVLDQHELDASSDLVLLKDDDGDECVSFEEFFPPAPPDANQALLGIGPRTPAPTVTVADIVRDAQEPLLARRLLAKYDRDRDLQLTAKELNWPAERLKSLDANGNQKLNSQELAALGRATPDVELSADLKPRESGDGAIGVRATAGRRLDASQRADYAKVAFSAAVVTFSHRNADPIASAIENAMRQFNQLDADANGYLDRDETAERIRFERGLFELMDADGDDKIFADEMKQYVAARGGPAATTCRVNVYDTGYGFFMALDANADGRVSVRELRNAPTALAKLDRDRRPGIGQKEPVRHFHIEFVRGSYQLFGPSEQLTTQTPAFQQRRPIGPIWFQRMDRNNDGDLTWNEFLGTREVFQGLDRDADGLIDFREAEPAR
jgi:Ca2+-binding EF-hand superfamily protein